MKPSRCAWMTLGAQFVIMNAYYFSLKNSGAPIES